jgi:hypothetical protein
VSENAILKKWSLFVASLFKELALRYSTSKKMLKTAAGKLEDGSI